jgi:hypothetical protein
MVPYLCSSENQKILSSQPRKNKEIKIGRKNSQKVFFGNNAYRFQASQTTARKK